MMILLTVYIVNYCFFIAHSTRKYTITLSPLSKKRENVIRFYEDRRGYLDLFYIIR